MLPSVPRPTQTWKVQRIIHAVQRRDVDDDVDDGDTLKTVSFPVKQWIKEAKVRRNTRM